MRVHAVGKEVTFTSIHSLPSNDDVPRDLGSAEIGGVDLSTELLKNGWAKIKESKRDPTEEDLKKKEIENEAKAAGKGVWNPHGPQVRYVPPSISPLTADDQARAVHHSMPEDSQGFLTEWKGKSIDGIVEHVRDGTNMRVRLLMPDGEHQIVNIALAGVRSPRTSSKQGEPSEQWSEEVSQYHRPESLTSDPSSLVQAKFFTESRLLHRAVRVQLLGLPNPTAAAIGSNTTGPTPASSFIGIGT